MTKENNVPAGTYDEIIQELEESLDSYQIPEYRSIGEEMLRQMKQLEEARK